MRPHIDEQKVENLIAKTLRGGVVAAALVLISGAALYLGGNPWLRVNYKIFRGEPEQLKTAQGVVRCAFSGQPQCLMQLGLLLLIATPILRVALSAVAFALDGDRMYLGFTLFVLGVLLYSLFGAFLIA